MQSRKASNSKKTNKNTNEAIVNEKSETKAQLTVKPGASRPSQSKKKVSFEAPASKSRRKSAVGVSDIPASESSLVANTLPEATHAPKAMSAAVGAESVFFESAAIDPVGVIAAPVNGKHLHQHSHEDVAKLAYSYWIARGYSHGLAEEDWLRAEAELTGKR